MRRGFIALVLLTSISIAGSASAAEDTLFGEVARLIEGMEEYLDATGSHFLTGVNSVVTSPADPVMSAWDPDEKYLELPLGKVTGRFFGAIQGIVMAGYRGVMGTLDMVLAPLPFAILSPEPRFQPIPGFEWDE